ncbi:protein POLR1D-like [Schistocerca piceifrons]|uniref:protein POLR1D-like n=1 Tax=Schistocerca piceifrons TaxID=274613 RepID=UPI001F5F03D1|nr:protein POLR1D-like [Schistocerca piceifrons]
MSTDKSLDELAEEELLKEAKRAAERASIAGALGWQKCPLRQMNKTFLNNTVINIMHANKLKTKKMQNRKAHYDYAKEELKHSTQQQTIAQKQSTYPKVSDCRGSDSKSDLKHTKSGKVNKLFVQRCKNKEKAAVDLRSDSKTIKNKSY